MRGLLPVRLAVVTALSRRLSRRRLALGAAAAAVLLFVPVWLPLSCPLIHPFLTDGQHALIALKNRSLLPTASDFDARVTLDRLLEPGDDRTRWSERRAARIEGYVIAVHAAGIELANCLSFTRRDIHIDVASRRDATPRERLVVEVTPVMRDWAKQQGLDWSERALARLVGSRAAFEGWLMFDREHDREAENTRPGGAGNWRATAWEIHPVTAIRLVE